MIITTASYEGSFVDLEKCPQAMLPEFAFIGRSNVGKSSLINLITGRRELALTSGRPGKTQTINFFLINKSWNLVDLPGYGYAKVSREQRGKWESMITNYLINRPQLLCVFQLVDGSIPPQKIDLEFANWLGEHQIPFSFIFTKSDKRPKGVKDPVSAFTEVLSKDWETLPGMFVTSSTKRIGREQVLDYLTVVLSKMHH